MTLCFTIASTLFSINGAVFGYINYKFGTRITRIIYFWLFVAGTLILGSVSKDSPWLMFPGLSLLAIGGLPVLVTNTQVSRLFKKHSSSLVGLLCGSLDMSSAVMLVVKVAYEKGFAPRDTFIIIAAVYMCLTAVSTFAFLPKGFIHAHIPGDDHQRPDDVKAASPVKDEDDVPAVDTDDVDLKSCLKNPMYIMHVAWLCILQLRILCFLGTVNTMLNRRLEDDDDQVSQFTNVLLYTMMGGLVCSLLAGRIHDWQKHFFGHGKSRSRIYQTVMPAILPLSITCGLAVLMSTLVLIDDINMLYVIFATMTLCKSFLFSIAVAFLTELFPIKYFGILYGTVHVSGGLVALLQYGFFTWGEAYNGAHLHTDVFLLGLTILSFGHPLSLWCRCRRADVKTIR